MALWNGQMLTLCSSTCQATSEAGTLGPRSSSMTAGGWRRPLGPCPSLSPQGLEKLPLCPSGPQFPAPYPEFVIKENIPKIQRRVWLGPACI